MVAEAARWWERNIIGGLPIPMDKLQQPLAALTTWSFYVGRLQSLLLHPATNSQHEQCTHTEDGALQGSRHEAANRPTGLSTTSPSFPQHKGDA